MKSFLIKTAQIPAVCCGGVPFIFLSICICAICDLATCKAENISENTSEARYLIDRPRDIITQNMPPATCQKLASILGEGVFHIDSHGIYSDKSNSSTRFSRILICYKDNNEEKRVLYKKLLWNSIDGQNDLKVGNDESLVSMALETWKIKENSDDYRNVILPAAIAAVVFQNNADLLGGGYGYGREKDGPINKVTKFRFKERAEEFVDLITKPTLVEINNKHKMWSARYILTDGVLVEVTAELSMDLKTCFSIRTTVIKPAGYFNSTQQFSAFPEYWGIKRVEN